MPDNKLVGSNYIPPDHIAKVTGRAKYAEDFRADGMLFTKLLLSPMPHARVLYIDKEGALAMPGVKAILTADDLPDLNGAEKALTNEPLYVGEPILAIAAVDPHRSRTVAVGRRSARQSSAGRSQRAARRQRLGGAAAARARRAGSSSPAGARNHEVDRPGFR
jgi:CO/xanthine dehydrogenase Mo-binding subunit